MKYRNIKYLLILFIFSINGFSQTIKKEQVFSYGFSEKYSSLKFLKNNTIIASGNIKKRGKNTGFYDIYNDSLKKIKHVPLNLNIKEFNIEHVFDNDNELLFSGVGLNSEATDNHFIVKINPKNDSIVWVTYLSGRYNGVISDIYFVGNNYLVTGSNCTKSPFNIPTYWLIDKNGKVIVTHTIPTDKSGEIIFYININQTEFFFIKSINSIDVFKNNKKQEILTVFNNIDKNSIVEICQISDTVLAISMVSGKNININYFSLSSFAITNSINIKMPKKIYSFGCKSDKNKLYYTGTIHENLVKNSKNIIYGIINTQTQKHVYKIIDGGLKEGALALDINLKNTYICGYTESKAIEKNDVLIMNLSDTIVKNDSYLFLQPQKNTKLHKSDIIIEQELPNVDFSHAIVIACDTFDSFICKKTTVNNNDKSYKAAASMVEYLINAGYKRDSNLYFLHNPNKNNFDSVLNLLIEQKSKNTVSGIMLYYSGIGFLNNKHDNNRYLAMCNYDAKTDSNVVDMEKIAKRIQENRVINLLFVIDACYMPNIYDAKKTKKIAQQNTPYIVIESTNDTIISTAIKGMSNRYFTYYFLQNLVEEKTIKNSYLKTKSKVKIHTSLDIETHIQIPNIIINYSETEKKWENWEFNNQK